MKWLVEIAGDNSDLSTLAQSFISSDINIFQDGQRYVLTSDRFDPSLDADTIHKCAEKIVELLNGASRIALDITQSIRVSAVYRYRENGSRDFYEFLEPSVVHVRALPPTVKITHTDGTVEESHPADTVYQWIKLAQSNGSVADVFRILSSGRLDWVNLYRIYEIIAADVGESVGKGENKIANKGWATKKSMVLFGQTANNPRATGLEARHGFQSHQPPSNPMNISEARSLINLIIHSWLREKTGQP